MTNSENHFPLDPLSEERAEEITFRLRQREMASLQAKDLAIERRSKTKGVHGEDADARDQLALVRLIYEAGKLTRAEYVFNCAMQTEGLHQKRWLAGAYDSELGPISRAMTDIEREHGLTEEQSFFRDSAPDEWLELNRQYEAVLDHKFGSVLSELGLDDVLNLWRGDRPQFDQLREAGRIAMLEETNDEASMVNLLAAYEREAQRGAEAEAYIASTLMLGWAAEVRLLLHCLRRPEAVHTTMERLSGKLRPKSSDPLTWRVEQLIAVAHAGGWVHNLPSEELVVALASWLERVMTTRGPLCRDEGPGIKSDVLVGLTELEDARDAYSALRYSLDYAAKASDASDTVQ